MRGIQQFDVVKSTSLGSPVSSSLVGDPFVDSRSVQKLVHRDDGEEELVLVHGDTDLSGSCPAERIEETARQPTSMDVPLCEVQNNRSSMGGLDVSGPTQSIGVESADASYEKHVSTPASLQNVLSDTISGLLMEDAMVTPCGHSFGSSGLLHVLETNTCLTCGASVHSDSLIPNYALRAAVLAYKREGTRRKKDLSLQAESKGRRFSQAIADMDVSRLKGVQFPYVANDRVLIKGNKRTPERFVGREAIITTQCLNGWYLVKTLDNGESVRLQYRSLQKVEDKEIITELQARIGNGKSMERACKLKGLSISVFPTSFSADCKDVSPSNIDENIKASSVPFHITKSIHSEYQNRTNRIGCGLRRRNRSRITDASGASLQTFRTSSSSSQKMQGEQVKKVPDLRNSQVHGRCTQEAENMSDSADDDKRATKRIDGLGTAGGLIEGIGVHTHCSIHDRKIMKSKSWKQSNKCMAKLKNLKEAEAVNAGEYLAGASCGGRSQRKHSRARPKSNSFQTHNFSSDGPDFQGADPYKKVYTSGFRRRAIGGNGHGLMASKHSAFASLTLDQQEADVKTSGESNGSQSVASFCEAIQKSMLDLESEIPWNCMQSDWKICQADWLRTLKRSSTVKDVGRRLGELRRALVLEKAGNMSDDEWNERLEEAVQLESIDAVDCLWNRLCEDISKLMDSKLKRDGKPASNMKFELLESKNLHPDLCIEGLSCVGMIAATSIAAAEAYAVDEQNIETLLAIPLKLVQEHSKQDLQAVIDAIEREKRHLLAKILNLSPSCNTRADLRMEDVNPMPLDDPNHVPVAPLSVAKQSLGCSEEPTLVRRYKDHVAAPRAYADSKEDIVPMDQSDGEETDLSDSD